MFDESKHPRVSDGTFTHRNGEITSLPSAKRIVEKIPKSAWENEQSSNTAMQNKSKSFDEFFGEEFKGVKEKAAIEKLLKEKRGHVKNAFERPEIGGIDLVWGNENGGLLHTIMRRDKQLKVGTGTTSGIDMANKIPEIIKKGKFSLGVGDRPNFSFNGYLVVISPAFDGYKVNWVLTAMEPQKKL